MWGEAAASMAGPALGIAASPVPVAAVIVLLVSRRAVLPGIAFAVGRVVGIVVVVGAVLAAPGLDGTRTPAGAVEGWARLALGTALVALSIVMFVRRPGDPTRPRWLERLDRLPLGAVLGLGFVASAGNPKNTALGIAGGVALASASLPPGGAAVALAAFTVVAASTVALPVLAYAVAGRRLDSRLSTLTDWLVRHNLRVISLVVLAAGAALVATGAADPRGPRDGLTCRGVWRHRPSAQLPAEAERVPGRVGVHLEGVVARQVLHRLEEPGAQGHDVLVSRVDVVDPQVEVDLLLRAVRPLRAGRGSGPAGRRCATARRRR